MNSGIYQIMNKKNFRIYIGSAVNLEKRWNKHKNCLQKGIHENRYLQNAWILYGESVFEFSEIEFVEKEDLIQREQYYLDLLNPEYNICKIAGNTLGQKPTLGKHWNLSEKTKKKISEAISGKNHPYFGKKRPEHSVAMKGENNPMYNKHQSEKTVQKISEKAKKRLENRENHPMYGKKNPGASKWWKEYWENKRKELANVFL